MRTFSLRYTGVLASRRLLFQAVFVMQAPKDRMADNVQMLRKPVPMPLPWHRERRERLREARTQGHMGTTCIVGPNLAKGQILANANPVRPHRRCSPVWS
jgi:hypothetical protein